MPETQSRSTADSFADGLHLPYSLEAEQAVLGAILVDAECISRVGDILRPEHFYLPEHQAIYTVMYNKLQLQQSIDFVTVLEELKADGFFAGEEGKNYLLKLTQIVPAISRITEYARIVREKYDVRMLIRVSRENIDDAMDPTADADELIDTAEQRIYDIRQGRHTGSLVPISEVLASVYDTYSKLNSAERDKYVGIPSGISTLDAVTTGLNRSDLIIVGARPGMGKTSFALNVARNVAVQANRKVAFFSLEMSREQIVNRLLSTEASVSGKKLRTGLLSSEEWQRIAAASSALFNIPFYVDDTPGVTVPQMKARLRRLKDVGLVVVDYLGLMQSAKKTENRVQEVSEITRNLKIMAKELNVPVIVCAQLSRGTEKQANHRPQLADLRESGSIEQDADQVLFLYRDEYYKNEKEDPTQVEVGTSEVIVAKNRHGELGTVKLQFTGEFTRFSAADYQHEAQ